jgi:hypothetical protein
VKIDALTVTLRPRTSWEAIELGMALTRHYAKIIWASWLVFTLPVLLLAHAVGWALHRWWIAGLLIWWLKPLFDRVPLYVLSRATFGDIPTLRQTLQAQRRWRGKWMWSYLSWRRLGPVRALYLPVDLLEGSTAERARVRRQEVGSSIYGISLLMTLMCCLFSIVLQLGLLGVALLFVPNIYLKEVFDHAGAVLKASPWWLSLIINVTSWLVMSVIEPFYIGAGFGLYINRRTQLEAWDIELTFRRLRTRLTQAASMLICLLALGLAVVPKAGHAYAAQASANHPTQQDADDDDDADEREPPAAEPKKLPQIFGDQKADDASFRQAVQRAYADPTLNPKRKIVSWKPRHPAPEKQIDLPTGRGPDLSGLGSWIAVTGKLILWGLLAALVIALALTAKRWLPWFRDGLLREKTGESESVVRSEAPAAAPLPNDVPVAIRRLWYGGRRREALALLYRATVDAMVAQTHVMLVPGATEAECLRASRRLTGSEDRDAFARVVRMWQYAAYAQSFPSTEAFESLLIELMQRFAWGPVGAVAGPMVATR